VVFSGTISSWVCLRFILIPKKFKFDKYWVWGNLSMHSLNYVNMLQWIKQFAKVAQKDLYKCITWVKKSMKGKQKWNKACFNYGLPQRN
jgi:hypothetical protein